MAEMNINVLVCVSSCPPPRLVQALAQFDRVRLAVRYPRAVADAARNIIACVGGREGTLVYCFGRIWLRPSALLCLSGTITHLFNAATGGFRYRRY